MREIRSEKIDTRAVLNGDMGDANFTNPRLRLAEKARVEEYWPDEMIRAIRDGFLVAPPWRLLVDPLSWTGDVPPAEVHSYVQAWLDGRRAWPSIDGLRRRFGRVSNHRAPDEHDAQESLL